MEPPEGSEQPPQQPWGRLLRLGADDGEPHVVLWKREWTIGRRRGCDLSFPSNKLVSGDHCKIVVDEKSGQVMLEDTSTNGTVINKVKVVRKQTCPLHTGDVIYLVYRKNEPEHNVAYLYESLNEKQGMARESCAVNQENTLHMTKDTSGTGRGADPQVPPSSSTTQACFEEPQPSTSTSDLFPTASASSKEPAPAEPDHSCSSGSMGAGISLKGCGPLVASDEMTSFSSTLPDREEPSFSLLEHQDPDDLEPIKKKMRGDGELDLSLQPLATDQCRNVQTIPEGVRAAAVKPDKMEETLTCIICQDLLHDCVSEEDVRSMDARNKITQDMLQPKVRRSFSDEEGSSEDLLELSDVDSESSDVSQPYVVCRQCPTYRRQAVQAAPRPVPSSEPGPLQALGDAPSTSATFSTAAQGYVCPVQGSHAICACCFQPMPDRRAEREQDPHVAPQQCAICLQPFCHLYWGCTRTGCSGCLAPFCDTCCGPLKYALCWRAAVWLLSDLNLFGFLTASFSENDPVPKEIGADGCAPPDYRISGNTVLCYCCGLRSFRELAYQYRQSIPASELPVAVTSRPDCYWGRNCRTQVKAHHAMKFNHICEQTRFKH
ncbi:E3 ubiquitin-protein ligase CHFR [Tupaia chinensis]|uniref:E3 ubiquitin-protein ligase CHFR n=1 Tax=Tupaia chinensis TaxID=246437 RepID=L9KWA4_TUPCH|nr:E3 ubiquitin-protein ligase CHFR [Tupaia chinensis]